MQRGTKDNDLTLCRNKVGKKKEIRNHNSNTITNDLLLRVPVGENKTQNPLVLPHSLLLHIAGSLSVVSPVALYM
jgi:hypothetical protein